MKSDYLSKDLLRDVAKEEQASEDCECKALTALTTALADEKLKVEGLEERVDRLLEDRRDILTVDTTDGLTASEWVLRTGHANTRAEQAEAKVARLVEGMKTIGDKCLVEVSPYVPPCKGDCPQCIANDALMECGRLG